MIQRRVAIHEQHSKKSLHAQAVHCLCTQQKRTCKIMQESCMQDLHGTCTRYVHFLARFLHYLARSCTYLARNGARNSKLAGNYSCSISCKILHHFLQDMCKILQDMCKILQDSARIVQENGHIACTCHASLACKILAQYNLARILHDLASSFLLGTNLVHKDRHSQITHIVSSLCIAHSSTQAVCKLETTWKFQSLCTTIVCKKCTACAHKLFLLCKHLTMTLS